MRAEKSSPRHVAVAIAYDIEQDAERDQVVVCLVSSRKHDGKLVLPKGGVEHGESSWQAAVREMWEEAGLRPAQDVEQHTQPQEPLPDHKPHKNSSGADAASPGFVPRAIYIAHQIRVRRAEELADWPERQERGERVWLPLAEARERIAWRKDIAACLARFSRQ